MTSLTFGIGPHWGDYVGSAQGVGRVAARIEALGFDALFAGEHLSFHTTMPDPFVVLAIAAAHTSRVRLETSVLILPLHQPFRLAHVAGSVDALSGGRLVLGVGVGGEGPRDFAAVEVPMEERGARADEILRILRRLWTADGEVTFAGKFYRLEAVRLMVRPAGAVGLGLHVWGSLAATREQARAHVAAIMETSYRLPLASFERYLFLGREEDWAERIREYAAAGVVRFNLIPCGPDFDEQLERAAAAVRMVRGA